MAFSHKIGIVLLATVSVAKGKLRSRDDGESVEDLMSKVMQKIDELESKVLNRDMMISELQAKLEISDSNYRDLKKSFSDLADVMTDMNHRQLQNEQCSPTYSSFESRCFFNHNYTFPGEVIFQDLVQFNADDTNYPSPTVTFDTGVRIGSGPDGLNMLEVGYETIFEEKTIFDLETSFDGDAYFYNNVLVEGPESSSVDPNTFTVTGRVNVLFEEEEKLDIATETIMRKSVRIAEESEESEDSKSKKSHRELGKTSEEYADPPTLFVEGDSTFASNVLMQQDLTVENPESTTTLEGELVTNSAATINSDLFVAGGSIAYEGRIVDCWTYDNVNLIGVQNPDPLCVNVPNPY